MNCNTLEKLKKTMEFSNVTVSEKLKMMMEISNVTLLDKVKMTMEISNVASSTTLKPGGSGVLPRNLGGGGRPAAGNPYPISDQICDFPYPISDLTHNSIPYFSPDLNSIKKG